MTLAKTVPYTLANMTVSSIQSPPGAGYCLKSTDNGQLAWESCPGLAPVSVVPYYYMLDAGFVLGFGAAVIMHLVLKLRAKVM